MFVIVSHIPLSAAQSEGHNGGLTSAVTVMSRNLPPSFFKLCRILTKAQSTSFNTSQYGRLLSGTNPETTEETDPSHNTKKWFCLPNSARSEIIHVAGSIFRLITQPHD